LPSASARTADGVLLAAVVIGSLDTPTGIDREMLRLRTAYRLTLASDRTAQPGAYGFGMEDLEGHEAE
jgi:hypothetical protein